LIEHNIIDLANRNLIQHVICKDINCFQNVRPNGDLVQGYNEDDPSGIDDELATLMADLIEDALILAL
jgi:hypothetical protein